MKNTRQTFLSGTTLDLVLLEAGDASIMTSWLHNPAVNQFLSMGAYPLTREAEEKFVEAAYVDETKVVFGIWHKADQKLIGTTGFHHINQLHQTASFGIVIGDPAYWSNGHGSEALKCMLHYAFSVRNLRSVTLSVLGNNPRGKRCYQKCGFRDVGTYTGHIFKAGAWHDEHLMIAHNPALH